MRYDGFADMNDYNFKTLVRIDVSLMRNSILKLIPLNLKEQLSLEEAGENNDIVLEK